ncbi:MAG: hypothetical protein WC333_01200 [Dehalococcoidia bacterium]|jgi:hypothetical protein
MPLDWNTTDTKHYVDRENKMMIGHNAPWNPYGDNGKGDAVERSFESYYMYDDYRFIEGIQACWVKNPGPPPRRKISKWWLVRKFQEFTHWFKRFTPRNDYYYQGYRYPTHYDRNMSRDHTAYTIIAYKHAGYTDEQLKEFVTHIPWKISDRHQFTPNMWLWARAVANIWWAKPLFYITEIFVMFLTHIVQTFVFYVYGIHEEVSQDEWTGVVVQPTPFNVEMARKRNPFPAYALHIFAWQLTCLKESIWKDVLLWIGRLMCPKHNYAMQILFRYKDKPTKEQVYGYKAMGGGRWTMYMNELDDRGMCVYETMYTPEELAIMLKANVIDVDYVRAVYEKKGKIG